MPVVGLSVFGILASGLTLSTAAASTPSVGAVTTVPGSAVVIGSFLDAEGEILPPVLPSEFQSGVMDVAAGNGFVLALKESGEVVAWPPGKDATQVPEEARVGVTAIAASSQNGYAVKHGRLIAWGNHAWVPSLSADVVDVAITSDWAVARTADGSVISWNPRRPPPQRYWMTVPAEIRDVDTISVQAYAVALKNGVPLPWIGRNLLPVPEGLQSGVTAAIATSGGVAVIKDGQVFEWSYDWAWAESEEPYRVISGMEAWPTTNRLDRLWIAGAALIGLGPSGQVETLRDWRTNYRLEENPLLWSHVQNLAVDPQSGAGIAIRSTGAPDPRPRLTMECKPVQIGQSRRLECSGTTNGIAPGERLHVFRNVWRDGDWLFYPYGDLLHVPGVMPVVKPDGTFRFRVSNPLFKPTGWLDGSKVATLNAYRIHYYHSTKNLELEVQSNYVEWRWPSR